MSGQLVYESAPTTQGPDGEHVEPRATTALVVVVPDTSESPPVGQLDTPRRADSSVEPTKGNLAEELKRDARGALSRAVLDVIRGRRPAQELTIDLFPLLFEGSVGRRRLVYLALRAFASPDDILNSALWSSWRYGGEDYLTVAASLLSDLGELAWPTLRWLAKTGLPECESFVPIIVRLAYLEKTESLAAAAERRQALENLARNPDLSTRMRLLESIEILESPEPESTLQILTRESAPQDEARIIAQERLNASRE